MIASAFAPTPPKKSRLEIPKHLWEPAVQFIFDGAAGTKPTGALAVVGPPGTGKTSCVLALIEHMGAEAIVADPGVFTSPLEGGASRAVNEVFLKAARVRKPKIGPARVAVLVFDDFHLAASRDLSTAATMNYGTMIGTVQALLDDPSRVFGAPTPYIPMIFTLNTLDHIPASLCRPGRMQIHRWSYTLEEQIAIICRIFPNISCEDAGYLILEYPEEPISRYVELRRLWESRHTRFDTANLAKNMRLALLGRWRPPPAPEPSGEQVIRLAAEVIQGRKAGEGQK